MEFFCLAVGRLLAAVVSCAWYWVVLDSFLVVVGGRATVGSGWQNSFSANLSGETVIS